MKKRSEIALSKHGGPAFVPATFLAKVGGGKSISKYQKGEIVFSQGEVGDAVFYIQKGKIKLTVVSKRGKEAVVGLIGSGHFLAKGVSTAIRCVSQQPQRLMNASLHASPGKPWSLPRDEPKFSELFMADLLSRNSRIEED